MPRHIEYHPLADLTPAVRNPKEHDLDGIRASIERFGLIEVAAVVDGRTGRMIGGHGRTDVLASLATLAAAGDPPPDGVELEPDTARWLVPVLHGWASRDDAEAEAALVGINHLTTSGGWRNSELAELLQALEASPGGLVGTGYNSDELESLLADLGAGELPAQDTDAAHAPGTNRGDPDVPREVQGLREVGLMFQAADHREYLEHLAKLKRAWGQDAAPVVVLTALRLAAESLG